MTSPSSSPRRPVTRASLVVAVIAVVCGGLVLIQGVRAGVERYQRDPGRDGKTRVLFVGDSMTFGASVELAIRFGKAGAEVRFVGFPSTGLLSGQGWWNREISHAVDTWRPDAVVIQACCNYRSAEPGWELDDGTIAGSNSPEMYEAWTDQANDAVDRASARGADVFWVVTPAADYALWPTYEERIPRFNEIAAETGAARIDWSGALTPEGEYQATMRVEGEDVKIRKDDGLHITDAGNALVAQVTLDPVAPVIGLD